MIAYTEERDETSSVFFSPSEANNSMNDSVDLHFHLNFTQRFRFRY